MREMVSDVCSIFTSCITKAHTFPCIIETESDATSDTTGSLRDFVVDSDSDSGYDAGRDEKSRQWRRSRDADEEDEEDGISIEEDTYGLSSGLVEVATAILGLQQSIALLRGSMELLRKDIHCLSNQLATRVVRPRANSTTESLSEGLVDETNED